MGFITVEMVEGRNERLLMGAEDDGIQRRHADAEQFCDPLSLLEVIDAIRADIGRQYVEYGEVAMVLTSAPRVTDALHRDAGCARVLLTALRSYDPRAASVELLYKLREGRAVWPRVLVTFQPKLTEPIL